MKHEMEQLEKLMLNNLVLKSELLNTRKQLVQLQTQQEEQSIVNDRKALEEHLIKKYGVNTDTHRMNITQDGTLTVEPLETDNQGD